MASDHILSKPVGHYMDNRGHNLTYKVNVYAARIHVLDDKVPEYLRQQTQVLQMYLGELMWTNLSEEQKNALILY